MSHPEVHGVVVIARNGDRTESWQDPVTYKSGSTISTPLGEVRRIFALSVILTLTYFPVVGSIAPARLFPPQNLLGPLVVLPHPWYLYRPRRPQGSPCPRQGRR